MKVLVVDDNPTSREILRDMMASFSFEVTLAATGQEGITEVEKADKDKPFEMVIMDWKMPGMDGIETTRTLQEAFGDACPDIIMVTAFGKEDLQRELQGIRIANSLVKELDEAAKIDGATHTQIFYGIILRLAAPILAVIGLLAFIGTSSDFVLANIILTKPESKTWEVGLYMDVSDRLGQRWTIFAAGAVLAAIPIVALFLYLQKYIVSGLTGGAVKG